MLRGHRLADIIAATTKDIHAVVMIWVRRWGGARQVRFTLNHQQLMQ